MATARPEGRAVYLVRSLGFSLESFHLTTGTFNQVVKDRIAFRLSGAPSVQNGDTQVRIRLSSKPYKVTVCAHQLSTHCAHRISTGYAHGTSSRLQTSCHSEGLQPPRNLLFERTTERIFRALQCLISARAEAEDSR